jgi:hypothetical protein
MNADQIVKILADYGISATFLETNELLSEIGGKIHTLTFTLNPSGVRMQVAMGILRVSVLLNDEFGRCAVYGYARSNNVDDAVDFQKCLGSTGELIESIKRGKVETQLFDWHDQK